MAEGSLDVTQPLAGPPEALVALMTIVTEEMKTASFLASVLCQELCWRRAPISLPDTRCDCQRLFI